MDFTPKELNILFQACLDTANALETILHNDKSLSNGTIDAYYKRIEDLRKLADKIRRGFVIISPFS